jgi:hypothetical protein
MAQKQDSKKTIWIIIGVILAIIFLLRAIIPLLKAADPDL